MKSNGSKKTLGRRKIEIKKIEKKSSLQVTFTKRRTGLFRKASELSVLCGAEIAILVQSPANKIFSFGYPSVGTLIDRFQTRAGFSDEFAVVARSEDGKSKYEEAVRKLEREKRVMEQCRNFWWDEPVEGMELEELEEYLEAMEALKDNVASRVEEMEKLKLLQDNLPSTSYADSDNYSGGFPVQFNHHGEEGEYEVEVLKVEAERL